MPSSWRIAREGQRLKQRMHCSQLDDHRGLALRPGRLAPLTGRPGSMTMLFIGQARAQRPQPAQASLALKNFQSCFTPRLWKSTRMRRDPRGPKTGKLSGFA